MTPDGWVRRRISEFANRSKVINVAGEVLRPLSITKGRGVVPQSEKYKKQIATDLRKYVVARRDQFAFDPMSLYYGAIGHIASVKIGLVSPDYVVFDVDNTVDKQFLNYLLRWPETIPVYEAVAETGNQFGKRRRVYWSVFEQLEFCLPPLVEQRKIAAILSSVDDAIDGTQAVIDQLQVVKKAMMAELLTRGLPGRHTRFKKTEIGEVPEEWTTDRLFNLCTRIVVGIVVKPASYYVPLGIPCLRSQNVREDRFDLTELIHISSDSNELLKKSKLRIGDVVTVRTGYPGTSCVVPKELDGANCVDLIVSTPGPRIRGSFLSRVINSDIGRVAVARGQGGLAQQHFNVGAMKEMVIPVPSIAEQDVIIEVLSSLDERIAQENASIKLLMTSKMALMSALLTGEVRVTPDEAVP